MKTFLLVLCVFVAAAYGGPGHRKAMDECLAENDLTREQFHTLKKNKDPKVGCIFACMMTKDGTLTDSTIDLDKIKERIAQHKDPKFNQEKATEAATTCVAEVQSISDRCEKVGAYKRCFFSKVRPGKPASEQEQPSE